MSVDWRHPFIHCSFHLFVTRRKSVACVRMTRVVRCPLCSFLCFLSHQVLSSKMADGPLVQTSSIHLVFIYYSEFLGSTPDDGCVRREWCLRSTARWIPRRPARVQVRRSDIFRNIPNGYALSAIFFLISSNPQAIPTGCPSQQTPSGPGEAKSSSEFGGLRASQWLNNVVCCLIPPPVYARGCLSPPLTHVRADTSNSCSEPDEVTQKLLSATEATVKKKIENLARSVWNVPKFTDKQNSPLVD